MIRVGRPVSGRVAGEHRVTAEADGTPIWFASADVRLRASVEAFGSALLIPALHRGETLQLAGRADATWRRNAAQAAELLAGWWGYPAAAPSVARRRDAVRRSGRSALCFTGGVDSFYSLLRGARRPEMLLNVGGFDVPLADADRARQVEHLVRSVADASGVAAVLARSNVREHAAFAAVNWERSHGGALAAAGHVLAPRVGNLLLSSTFSRDIARPWGSHWQLDPLWSSSRLAVVHAGDDVPRLEKARRLADEPLVQRHLRVCWENRSAALNCSRCDKCLVTMVVLAEAGRLDRFALFDGPAVLAGRLDALPTTRYLSGYGDLLRAGLRPDVHRAVARLVERTMDSVGIMHA